MSRNHNEIKLCIAFTAHCEIYFPRTPGGLNWTHIANEGRSPQEGAKLKKMGVNAGWFDYSFVWAASNAPVLRPEIGFLEAKWGNNDYSSTQKRFVSFMRPMNIPCEKFYSVAEGHSWLLRWGIKPMHECRYFKEPNTMTWDDKIALMHAMYAPRKEKP